jgi:hypothetical protein
MMAPRKIGPAAALNGNRQPVATFKNSLRSWQAQWKARRSAQANNPAEGDKLLAKGGQP